MNTTVIVRIVRIEDGQLMRKFPMPQNEVQSFIKSMEKNENVVITISID